MDAQSCSCKEVINGQAEDKADGDDSSTFQQKAMTLTMAAQSMMNGGAHESLFAHAHGNSLERGVLSMCLKEEARWTSCICWMVGIVKNALLLSFGNENCLKNYGHFVASALVHAGRKVLIGATCRGGFQNMRMKR